MTDMEALQYLWEYETKGRNPAAFEEMFTLERAGLVVCLHAGWGHYQVTLTAEGKKMLARIAQ